MTMSLGTRLGPYEITAPIGAGGMGQVWRAHDSRLERDVALKVLPTDALGDDTARVRLVREARLASKLNHPHICTIYEVGESDPSTPSDPGSLQAERRSGKAVTYIAMELVEGQPLSARVADGPLPVEQILRYGQQMADALAHAHGRGVVHRDFKSANVVVTPEGQVKVLDFGLAKRLTGEELADVTTVSRHSLTAPGVVAGTLAYMAPEQLKGQPADARSDIWALGVVLYELAAGRQPFQGQTGFELTGAILNQPVPPLPLSVPAPLAGVIDRCLAKEPGERYQRGSEVRAALEAVASGEMGAAWSAWRVVLHRRRRLLLSAATGVLALLVVAALLFGLDVGGVRLRVAGDAAVSAGAIRLAVLPFANVSGDADQEYLSDGLTTEMIAMLGRLHPGTLSVIARQSVVQFKKTDKPINEIGRELGVDYILEGSAQREAGRIRITADLIKVAGQTQLWTERYERELAGILALQNDVAQQVASALALKLLPSEQARLAGAKAVNPEAYDACLRGMQQVNQLTPQALDIALEYFELALKKDPNYALAYAGISQVWMARNQMGYTAPPEGGPRAKAAALKAIELDGALVQGHQLLAALHWLYEWDWARADAEYKRALELNPNFADSTYSQYLLVMKRPEEAEAQMQRALQLDPLSEMVRLLYSFNLYAVGRYDEAIVEMRKLLRTAPQSPSAHWMLSGALFRKGKHEEALAEMKAYYAGDSEIQEALTQGYAQSGYRGAMRRAADLLAARTRKTYLLTSDIAQAYALAGDEAQTLAWLEKGFETRDPNAPYVTVIPEYAFLRDTPRFKAIVRRLNLPE